MSYPSTRARVVVLAVLTSVLIPALPAAAQSEGDFEIVFPHDVLVTRFTNSWGDARSGGRAHRGSDLMAPKGTPVYAIADGLVKHMQDGDRSGRWLGIEHDGGYESWYMHLNNDTPGTDDGAASWDETVVPGLEIGDRVRAGQLVAWVGDSGNAEPSSPHTHFEIHKNGSAVNPYPFLADAYERGIVDVKAQILPALSGIIAGVGSSLHRPEPPPELLEKLS
jgi:murein DD-endopeptidase MepM/ murein hydrolase activator NlpD